LASEGKQNLRLTLPEIWRERGRNVATHMCISGLYGLPSYLQRARVSSKEDLLLEQFLLSFENVHICVDLNLFPFN
jgi:hypothetical protein